MNTSTQSAETKSAPKRYTRRSEAEWRELIKNAKKSDMSLEDYCQCNTIALSSFYAWRKRFESEVETDTLIDITPQLSASSSLRRSDNTSWQVELELSRDCILRISTA